MPVSSSFRFSRALAATVGALVVALLVSALPVVPAAAAGAQITVAGTALEGTSRAVPFSAQLTGGTLPAPIKWIVDSTT